MVVQFAIDPVEKREGYFYVLLSSREDDLWLDRPEPGLVESVEPQDEDGEDILNVRPVGCHAVYWSRCGHSDSGEHLLRVTLEYTDTREVGSVSWFREGAGMVCKKDLAIRLLTSDLLGLMVQRPEWESPGGYPEPKDWYYIQGAGPAALKRPRMSPEPYRCWNCNNEPVCSICGRMEGLCPYCEADYNIPISEWDGKDTKMLVYDPPPMIVDLQDWNGSDMFGPIITHRMLQFLLSCHAHPFRVLPMPVDVKGASPQDLKRLETARTPL